MAKKLIVWVGPTSSAKSSGAIGMAHRIRGQGKSIILIRPKRSMRNYEDDGMFLTKDGAVWPSFDVDHPHEIEDIVAKVKPFAVWIDEPALFVEETTTGLPPWLFETVVALREKCMILVSGISSTSELEVFGKSFPLILAVADEIIQCRGDCPWCGRFNVATRSMYLGSEEKLSPDLVGGADVYQPACDTCWNEIIKSPAAKRRGLMKQD